MKGFPCKKWRKNFIGDFHVKLNVSFKFFTRDFPVKKNIWKKFLKRFLLKILVFLEIGIECWAVPAIDLMKWKWKWSEVKWSIFGPLHLFIFGYVQGGVLGNNNIGGKKCTTTFLWVLNLGQVGGHQKIFQNLATGMIFSKMMSNLSIQRLKFGKIWWFFSEKFFLGISFVKFTTFLKSESILQGFFFKKIL